METIPLVRQFRTGTGPFTGRGKSKKKPVQEPPGFYDTAGFLRHSFLPLAAFPEPIGKARKAEKQFFSSLEHFAGLYNLEVPVPGNLPFPLNMDRSFKSISEQFSKLGKKLEPVIIKDGKQEACIATVKQYQMRYSLFYIAVQPVVKLMQRRKRRRSVDLLLSVFSYLYRVMGIPFYTECSSYLYNCYEVLENYLTDAAYEGDEDTDYASMLSEFRLATYWGNQILRTIRHPYTLQSLEERVRRFRASDKKEEELLSVCKAALDLYRQYPKRSIFEDMPEGFLCPEEKERIRPDQYISFFWSDQDLSYEQLMEHINYDLQEMAASDEPIAIQLFNAQQEKEHHDMSFIEAVFDLLNSLSNLLCTYSDG